MIQFVIVGIVISAMAIGMLMSFTKYEPTDEEILEKVAKLQKKPCGSCKCGRHQ